MFEKIKSKALNEDLKSEQFEEIDLYAKFVRKQNLTFQIKIRGLNINFEKGKFYFNEKELPTLNKKEVNIRVLLDRTTIEVFVDDGFSVLSSYAVPASDEKSIFIKSDKTLLFDKFEVNELQSIWP